MSEAPVLEVLRFTGEPVSADVALLELEGVFAEHAPRGRERARLLLECADTSLEVAPASIARLPEGVWRGSYAVPLAFVGGSVYSLAVGRDLLLDLPAPDMTATSGGPATHHVRLAREANELRRRLDEAETVRNEATAAAEAALAGEAVERAAREELEATLAREAAALAEAGGAREQAETALAAATAEAEQREQAAREAAEQGLAAVRGALEQELTAAREQAARERATAQEETDRRLEGQQTEAERRVEEAIAAERARASVTSHELRSARAEIEQLRRELGVLRSAGKRATPANGDGPAADEEITARRVRASDEDEDATRRVEPVAATAATTRMGDDDQTVRVLSPRAARPRHRPEDETEPESLSPGAALTGARSFEGPGAHVSSSRALAFAALAVAFLAALLVIVLRVGVF
jgi:hypothetical protein